jgi:hypothetical protein
MASHPDEEIAVATVALALHLSSCFVGSGTAREAVYVRKHVVEDDLRCVRLLGPGTTPNIFTNTILSLKFVVNEH